MPIKSILEEMLYQDLKEASLINGLVREYKFASPRKYSADFAYPDRKILVEVEGGTRQNGRHNRADGYQKDCYKYNLAQKLGYRVLRYTSEMVMLRVPERDLREILEAV